MQCKICGATDLAPWDDTPLADDDDRCPGCKEIICGRHLAFQVPNHNVDQHQPDPEVSEWD
jgi:hypothetical protein